MKVRESGMPPADMWSTFFDPDAILSAMEFAADVRAAVDFGCGYGTFTIPAARRTKGVLHAFDISPEMIEETAIRAKQESVANIKLYLRDFVANGTGLDAASVDYVMLFNILHAEDPLRLLCEADRILSPGGRVAVIHWNYDPKTPRGPSMTMRPHPEDCRRWIRESGFIIERAPIDLPPYHYGLLAKKEGL